MKITLLGTGTPSPSLKRASSSYLVEIDDDVIVLDHGPGAHQRLLEAGKQAGEVNYVFLSHLHYDHFLDYPRLVLQRWDMGAGKIPELKVFGPAPIEQISKLLFAEDGVFGRDIHTRTNHQGSIDIFEARGGKTPRQRPQPEVLEISKGDIIKGKTWKLAVGGTSHVQPDLECLAFRLDTDDCSMCYAGDSGGVCEDVITLAKNCDVLIVMNHFFSGTEPTDSFRRVCGSHLDNAAVAEKADVKTLVLSHVLEQIDQPGIREKIITDVGKIYKGNIIWGEDLMQIPIAGPDLHKLE